MDSKVTGSGVEPEGLWEKKLCPHLKAIYDSFPESKPCLWVTGHSLGAAAATVFTSMMIWRRSPIGKSSPIRTVDWEPKFTLAGTYTYGNPRVGDNVWHDVIDSYCANEDDDDKNKYSFYRIINANDVVCAIPPAFKLSLVKSGITLNDFRHLGQPVQLPYRHGKCVRGERCAADVIKNIFQEIVYTPEQLFKGSFLAGAMVLLNFCSWGAVGILRDHIPSEYLQNLKACDDYKELEKSREETGVVA
jgi:hypothetical protein